MSYLRPRRMAGLGLSGIQSQPPGPRIARVALSDSTVTGDTSPTPSPAAVAAATTAATPTPPAATSSSPSYLTYGLYAAAAYFGYRMLFGKKGSESAPSPA